MLALGARKHFACGGLFYILFLDFNAFVQSFDLESSQSYQPDNRCHGNASSVMTRIIEGIVFLCHVYNTQI